MRQRLAATVVLACVALAACGEGDETQRFADSVADAYATGDRATKKFRKRFEEVCRATQRALTIAEREELGDPGTDADKPTRAELQRFYEEVVVPARRAEAETLAKIEPPPELESAIGDYLAEHRAATDALGADLALIRQPGIEETAFAKADAAADAAGVPRC